ncbi:MAG: hypothetical protein VKI83_08315 [Synechococcaceae cyanobacterium]|nr:hypothetical protein [Synechococcaceae cyanobacterium]
MSLAVLDRQLTPADEGVMTFHRWEEIHERLDGCLHSRDVHWHWSLVSLPGDRSLCLFEVAYADLVREACREACMPFEHVWAARQSGAWDARSLPQGSRMVVAQVRFEAPLLNEEQEEDLRRRADECFHRVDARRLTSFLSPDRSASVCLFDAPSAESVRGVYRSLALSTARVWPAVLLRPEP